MIGISCELRPPEVRRTFSKRKEICVLNREYTQAIEAVGGIPYILPVLDREDLFDDIAGRIDGLILSGGGDVVEPSNPRGSSNANLRRTRNENRILRAVLRAELPVLGICRGLQQINVFFGGTLWDDLPTQKPKAVNHRGSRRDQNFRHKITVELDSELASAFGNPSGGELDVNSTHHQAARKVGKSLRVVARAEDGVIEALESVSKSGLWAVQWHPERLGEHPAGYALLRRFIASCTNRGHSVSEPLKTETREVL